MQFYAAQQGYRLRYSDMRIVDTATGSTDRVTGKKLFLYTHKTNVPVYCKLPSVLRRCFSRCQT
jgi:hypothetical protein